MGKRFTGFLIGVGFCTMLDYCCNYNDLNSKKRINNKITEILQKTDKIKTANIIKNDTFIYWPDEEKYINKNLKGINDSIKRTQDSIRIDSLAKAAYAKGIIAAKKHLKY